MKVNQDEKTWSKKPNFRPGTCNLCPIVPLLKYSNNPWACELDCQETSNVSMFPHFQAVHDIYFCSAKLLASPNLPLHRTSIECI